MPQAWDVLLDGRGYMVAPGSYRRGLDAAGVGDLAALGGLRVHGLTTEHLGLEQLFLELTGPTGTTGPGTPADGRSTP